MRPKLILSIGALVLMCLATTPALAIGLYVERLQNPQAVTCPICHRPIMAGDIHENAEQILATQFGGGLAERSVEYTNEKGQKTFLNIFVYRFQERRGGNFSVVKPASVGFHAHLFQDGGLVGLSVFDETQQPLSDNVLRIFTFFKRGAKWITAGELAREGVHKALDELVPRLNKEAEGQ